MDYYNKALSRQRHVLYPASLPTLPIATRIIADKGGLHLAAPKYLAHRIEPIASITFGSNHSMTSTKPARCLLLGLKRSVLDDTVAALEISYDSGLYKLDHVFIGAGLDVSIRVEATKTVPENSLVTQVHLKNVSAGMDGYMPFTKTILAGIKAARSGTA